MAARNVADPECPHELQAGEPFEILSVPFPQLGILGALADDRILHDGVAEVIHHRGDSEDASQPFVETFLRRTLFGLGIRLLRLRQYSYRGSGECQSGNRASSCDCRTSMYHVEPPGRQRDPFGGPPTRLYFEICSSPLN